MKIKKNSVSKMKNVEKALIEIALKIAKQGKGCLFAIENKGIKYENLLPQDVKPFSVVDNLRRVEALALLDGACIIDRRGNLVAYAVKIKNTKSFMGYGTRHSAAYTASMNENTAILASEEDMKVRIFRNGKLLIQMDPFQKGIEKKSDDVVNLLESIGFGSVAAIGTTLLAPAVGLALIPGIILFGTSHYLIKLLMNKHAVKG